MCMVKASLLKGINTSISFSTDLLRYHANLSQLSIAIAQLDIIKKKKKKILT